MDEPWDDGGMDFNPITYFARTNYRGESKPFGIKQRDRLSHVYVIGKTGTGKSTLLETMMLQDLENGIGFALFDPHGDLVERVMAQVPGHRREDVLYLDVADRDCVWGYNPLEHVPTEKKSVAVSGLLEVFRKHWPDFWGPRLEHILRNALFVLLDQPEATLADVPRLFDDKAYRREAVLRTANAHVRDFWLKEYEGYPARLRAEAIAPIQNKVGAFLADPILSRVLTQRRSTFSWRQVIDEGKVLLVNLAKGKIGEGNASLLGSLLLSGVYVAALGRADQPQEIRRDFILYLDEFQSVATPTLSSMLSELRKFHVGMVLAHQFLSQIDPLIRDAILGNVGTLITFRVGLPDAEFLAKEFFPDFSPLDFTRLPNHEIYLRLMIDGRVSRGFSGEGFLFQIPAYSSTCLSAD